MEYPLHALAAEAPLFLALILACAGRPAPSRAPPPPPAEPTPTTCLEGLASQCVPEGLEALEAGDPDKAKTLYEKGCEGDQALACANLAGLLYEADAEAAKPWFVRACDLKDVVSCTNLGVLAQQAGDLPNALEYLGRACDAGHGPSCASWLGGAQQACGGADFALCLKAAEASKSPIDASHLRSMACDSGHEPACQNPK